MAVVAGIWFALGGAVLSAYILGVVVYRVWFHPMSKYPGPFLAKVSDVYMLYHAWKGDRHLEFWRLHEKYGKFVRFGPSKLSINSNTALKTIYGVRSNVQKSEFYDAFVHPAPNTHNCRDKEMHARKRRVLSQAFSDGAMKEMERYILGNVRTFCEGIGDMGRVADDAKGWGPAQNMADWCSWLAMDILGDLCFGKAFHMLERPDNRYAIHLVGLAAMRHNICGTMPAIPKLGLDKLLFRKIAAGRAQYLAYSHSQLAERTKLGDDADRRDFFYHLLKARDPETGLGFSPSELWGESNLLIIAGSDTTSTAMSATLFYLVRNPSSLEKVTAEVRRAFSDVEDIHQGSSLTSCAYLRACIDEAMRLSPSVGGLLPREVLPGGITIDGEVIAAGTVVGTPHYAIHHHPEYYPQPFRYIPERWMATASPKDDQVELPDVGVAQSAFCPFSIGPRGCVGKNLAYGEMMTTLARVLFLYDVRSAASLGEGSPGAEWGRHRKEEYQLVDTFTSVKDGPLVQFRKRA